MKKLITKDEINQRLINSGVDAKTDDVYINAKTPMEFYCSNGHKWHTKLGNVTHNHQGCPYCSGHYLIRGKTDLATTHPEIVELLLNVDDGYNLTKSSAKKVKFKCKNCGAISEHIVSNIVQRGFSCPVCSDGISYPNKFMASMLEQLNVDYNPEYTIDGQKYRYDFFVPQYNMIIEMHGRQHYEEWNRAGISLEDEQKNDALKMDFAIHSGIQKYIIIDSKQSDIKYISNNILQSELNNIFNLTSIDWTKCGFYAAGSLVSKTAKLYNDGLNVDMIAECLKVSKNTVRKWLSTATELGLCSWAKSDGFLNPKHKIILLNTHEIFDSISAASRQYHVHVANISSNCQHRRSYAGIHPATKEPMVWRYIEDYDENEVIDFISILNPHINYKTILYSNYNSEEVV